MFAMASVFDDLANIDSSKDSWKILVKVVHLWSTRRFNGCKIPHAVELALMDSKVVFFVDSILLICIILLIYLSKRIFVLLFTGS